MRNCMLAAARRMMPDVLLERVPEASTLRSCTPPHLCACTPVAMCPPHGGRRRPCAGGGRAQGVHTPPLHSSTPPHLCACMPVAMWRTTSARCWWRARLSLPAWWAVQLDRCRRTAAFSARPSRGRCGESSVGVLV
eukprot:306051-Chlamydomonas_euryale.AAC.1